jgi:hypothetical protein
VYYAMEDSSKVNAERMAAMTPGASASDFSHTLITDMNDRQKPGDITWKPPPPNPVSQSIQAGRGGWQGTPSGATPAEIAAMAHQGADAFAGRRAAAMVQTHHFQSPPPFRTIGTYMPPKS